MKNADTTKILEALDMTELPKEEQEELLLDLGSLVFEGTMLRLIERMDDGTREKFEALLDQDASEEEIMAFLRAQVPGADAAVAETLDDIRNDILAATGNK